MRNRALALGLVSLVSGRPAAAQSIPADTSARVGAATSPTKRGGDTLSMAHRDLLVGFSFGVPGYESEPVPELFTLGVHWTHVRPGQLGADVSLGTMPRALTEGVLVLGVRAGIALAVPVSPGVLVLPSGGMSLIGGAGGGGGGGAIGVNGGVAAIVRGTSASGLRVGITWHQFQDAPSAVWLAEFGFVR